MCSSDLLATTPTPQDRAESDQDGHPDKVKRKGAAREPKKDEKWIHFNINHRVHRGAQRRVKSLCALCVLGGFFIFN